MKNALVVGTKKGSSGTTLVRYKETLYYVKAPTVPLLNPLSSLWPHTTSVKDTANFIIKKSRAIHQIYAFFIGKKHVSRVDIAEDAQQNPLLAAKELNGHISANESTNITGILKTNESQKSSIFTGYFFADLKEYYHGKKHYTISSAAVKNKKETLPFRGLIYTNILSLLVFDQDLLSANVTLKKENSHIQLGIIDKKFTLGCHFFPEKSNLSFFSTERNDIIASRVVQTDNLDFIVKSMFPSHDTISEAGMETAAFCFPFKDDFTDEKGLAILKNEFLEFSFEFCHSRAELLAGFIKKHLPPLRLTDGRCVRKLHYNKVLNDCHTLQKQLTCLSEYQSYQKEQYRTIQSKRLDDYDNKLLTEILAKSRSVSKSKARKLLEKATHISDLSDNDNIFIHSLACKLQEKKGLSQIHLYDKREPIFTVNM